MMRRTYSLIASALASFAVIGAIPSNVLAQDAASGEAARAEPLSSQHDRISALIGRVAGKQVAHNDGKATPAFYTEQPKQKRSPLSLRIDRPNGTALRLDYVPGDGWQSSNGQQAEGVAPRPVAQEVGSGNAPSRPEEAASGERPLSVFVDGPTGFVFVWTHDAHAWKFVGRLSER